MVGAALGGNEKFSWTKIFVMTNAPFTAALELLRNRIIVLSASKHNRRRRVLREKVKDDWKNPTLQGISKEIAAALNCLLSTKCL